MIFAWAIFAVSILPLLAFKHPGSRPVEELRPLSPAPQSWDGPWYALDRNYARFERWFSDNLGMRNWMIRSKNEIDYRLFRTSSRVYYGKDGELYGRNLLDNELPATERLLGDPLAAEGVYRGLLALEASLRAQGVTMLLIAPIQKHYYTYDRLPVFAPHPPLDSNFLAFYRRLLATPQLHMIDVKRHLDEQQHNFPLFFRQDFHWTDVTAAVVAQDTVNHIAALEGHPLRWNDRPQFEYRPFVGVETRFAARLNTKETLLEPQLKRIWEAPAATLRDAKASGWEFETAQNDAPALLPPTCMFGNSFSDGMLRAGLPEQFQRFSKLDRALQLRAIPPLLQGRCRYLIVQVLDIQTGHWSALAQ
ncbi:hypothetical protein [Massilia sp. BJB1822]|uniref:alginate O-acetyltransferase AlgX-related protein n=1 Tax=Massilia sp. BJB1822 TaxID=2744470 RepID=UPI001593ED5A|nr:hypothetical protein [Massilia sp. BJB1822]NVD97167.1 hypothetical protein [Massilia sp. BJB1822]